ncbi:hypothetical protein [Rheinheimera sp. MM224]|uniref:hypothetical protein n=1 Tax=Rheinheimera sp. MM224 TaxID=3019969 RepID=UPI0021F8BD0F|nr:hypothetical protein [Rheinheimera sp. MM224]CAI3798096.1 hypothetical protein JAMGFMIE_01986 [Rheinheimera sp. MM224]
MKFIRNLFSLIFLLVTGYFLFPVAYDSAMLLAYQHGHSAIVRAHLRFLPDERYNIELQNALKADDIDTANQLSTLGFQNNVMFEPGLLKELEDKNSAWMSVSRSGDEIWNGLTGKEVKTFTGLSAAVAADLTTISDFTDLYQEFQNYPDYDNLTVGLSLLGITATGMAFASGGISAAKTVSLRLMASSIKMFRKAGRFSKQLEAELIGSMGKLVNKDAVNELYRKTQSVELSQLNSKQMSEMSVILARSIDTTALRTLRTAADDSLFIASKGGLSALSNSFKAADNLQDLSRLKKVATLSGDELAGIVKLAPRLAKPLFKAMDIIYQAIAFLFGAFVWVISVLKFIYSAARLVF